MKAIQDEIADRQAVLNIELEPSDLEKHLQKAYQRLVARVTVPGFRKGKAPRRIFEQAFGHDRLVDEALETMVPEAVSAAIEQESIDAAGTPRISVVERDPTPKIQVTVPLSPVVTLGDYRAVHFDDQPPEVTEAQIDAVLDRARETQATWEPSETPVTVGDMAVLESIEGHAAGKEIVNARQVEYEVLRDSTHPVPGFATELTGLEADESKTFELILPDDYSDKKIAGETATFKVSVSEVKRKRLPELDDDFAKGVDEDCENLADLRTKIRAELEQTARGQHQRELQDKILDTVVKQSTIEIPPLIVQHEAEHVLTEQQEALSRYRISLNDYMTRVGKSTDEMVGEANESARERLERSLVLEKLAEAEGVEVTEDEVNERIQRLKALAKNPQERASYDSDRVPTSIRDLIRREKTLDCLVELTAGSDKSERSEEPRIQAAVVENSSEPQAESTDVTPESRESEPAKE